MAQQDIENLRPTAGLMSIFPQTEVIDHPASVRVMCVFSWSRPQAFVEFLDRDYRYKSVTTQIPRCWVATDPIHWQEIPLAPLTELRRTP